MNAITPHPPSTGAALYLHIPFCERRCTYCDFYTIAGVSHRLPDYVQALQQEIARRAAEPFWQQQQFETVFFGGGTPSLLSPAQLTALLDQCFKHLRFIPAPEITLEANPGTITSGRLAEYRALGINRMSFGVQSFDAGELTLLDRIHTPEEARAAIRAAHTAGFANVNLDLIFALPGQTLDRWLANLAQAVALEPTHVSCYNLTIAAGTPIAMALQQGKLTLLEEEEERRFHAGTIDFLEAHGLEHYEVSNYARPGYAARHNLKYWDGSAYLGLGASAHSHAHRRRFWNVANLRQYLEAIGAGRLAEAGAEQLTREQAMFEFTFLGLRQRRGLDLRRFAQEFGVSFLQVCHDSVAEMEAQGWLEREDSHVRLTREGLFLCDEICARLACDLEQQGGNGAARGE